MKRKTHCRNLQYFAYNPFIKPYFSPKYIFFNIFFRHLSRNNAAPFVLLTHKRKTRLHKYRNIYVCTLRVVNRDSKCWVLRRHVLLEGTHNDTVMKILWISFYPILRMSHKLYLLPQWRGEIQVSSGIKE